MSKYIPISFNNRELLLPKAILDPELGSSTVLTNEPWEFVDLALTREGQKEAQFYWRQAREFYNVAQGLPLQSAPLLLYYSYMNATKALLSAKEITFNKYHGVKGWEPNSGGQSRFFSAGVEIKNQGILPSLSSYYGEAESLNQHSLKDLLYNLPFIHRTFSLTYASSHEMFIPLVHPRFVYEEGTNNVYFSAKLSKHYTNRKFLRVLPPSISSPSKDPKEILLSSQSVVVSNAAKPTDADIAQIATFATTLRSDVFYINGIQTLWYLKVLRNSRLKRQTTTLTLAAMHRLSEVCRYAPMELDNLLQGQKNWLLSEFIRMSGTQFIDELASEITGKIFMVPNVRPAN